MFRLLALTLALFTLACVAGGPEGLNVSSAPAGISPDALVTETIVAQPLDAVAAQLPTEVDPDPQPLQPLSAEVVIQAAPPAAVIAGTEPKPPSSPEEAACVKKGGLWIHAGKSIAYTCIRITRDSGKQCRKGSDCQGSCLARSMTCAPYDPLFGCNDILQDDGSRVTLCID